MPQVTVYIRTEDLEAWKAVVKKSEFMHNALQNHSTYDGAPIVLREDLPKGGVENGFAFKVIKTKEDAEKVVKHLTPAQLADKELLAERRRRMGL